MKNFLIILSFVCLGLTIGTSQQIMIDRGTRVSDLWCFPIYGDSLHFLYLPSDARLGLDDNSMPQFSFMRYIIEIPENDNPNTISEAGGGAIVNFLVLYDTPSEQIQKAEAALQERFNNDEIRIKGPVVFTKGRYTLVSSILMPDGNKEAEVMGTGEAPILENSRIAFSFDLDPVRSKLLLENFTSTTPDISLVFELSFTGLTDSYQAELTVDWTEMRKSKSFDAGGSVYFVGADVELAFDELFRENAIRLNVIGSNPNMEGLLNTVYSRLLDMLFRKVEPEKVPESNKGGLMDAIGALLGKDGPLSSRKTFGFGLNVGYQWKENKTEGESRLYFRGRSTVERNHFITFNIGDLYKKHEGNKSMFRDVPLYDPAFQQRAVHIGVDGSLEKEFKKMVNNVTVKVRKQHNDGTETLKEVLVNEDIFQDSLGRFKVIYLNRGDTSMTDWLFYEYQTLWQFVGGGTLETEWDTTNAAMINLFAPFQRRMISLEGDLPSLSEEGIRAISVRINYPFFSEIRKASQTIRPKDDLAEKHFEVTLPLGHETVDYQVIWIKKDATRIDRKGTDDIGMIFIDELPQN